MGKFKNVNLVSIFAIVLVALGAFGRDSGFGCGEG